MARRRSLLLGVGGAAAVALGVGAVRRRRRPLPPDQTDGRPLELPAGDERRLATRDGGELAVHVAGAGARTVVLCHGWTNDRRMWAPVARRLVELGHRVVAYDQRGHAGSTAGSDGLTLSALAGDLATVLAHLDTTDVVVVGHSMGGMTAQALLVERPEVVEAHVGAVVLVSTACEEVGGPDALVGITGRVLASPLLDCALSSEALGRRMVRGTVGRHAHPTHLAAVLETLAATPAGTRTGFALAMAAMDFGEALAQVDLPVAVIVGSRDRLTPPAQSRRLAAVIEGATLQVVPDAGHMLSLEAPDELTDLIVRTAARIPA